MKTKFFLIALISLFLFAACGKGDEPKPGPSSYSIALTTQKAVRSTIKLLIEADEADEKDVWIDLNNNGKKDAGEGVFFGEKEYTIGAQTITVYGKVHTFYCENNELSELVLTKNKLLWNLNCSSNKLSSLNITANNNLTYIDCSYNQLTALDISNKPALRELFIYSNHIAETQMQKIVDDIPTCDADDEGKIIVFHPIDSNEKNKITAAQLTALKIKNWNVLYF